MTLDANKLDEPEYCMGCEKAPPNGYWKCPVCDAEWHDEYLNEKDETHGR